MHQDQIYTEEEYYSSYQPSKDYSNDSAVSFRPNSPKLNPEKENEDLYHNVSSSNSPPQFGSEYVSPSISKTNKQSSEASSKAYAQAMKALQDKIKLLESDNNSYKSKLLSLEGKSHNDREKWQIRLIEELKNADEVHKSLEEKNSELEDEVRLLQQKNFILEEQTRIKDTQIQHQESEIKRNSDQFLLDRDNLSLENAYLKKQVSMRNSDDRTMIQQLESCDREKELAKEELAQERRIVQSLQAEISFLRENSDAQRNSLQKVIII